MMDDNRKTARGIAALFAAVVLASCAAPEDEANALTGSTVGAQSVKPGTPGGLTTETSTLEATVVDIDYKTRKVTLQDQLGHRKTMEVGPQAVNFNQVQKGDTVRIVMVDELLVYVRDKNTVPAGTPPESMMARSPVGQKPAFVAAESAETVAVVKALDMEKHTATLQFADGRQKTIRVRDDVELDPSQIGKEVVFRLSKAVAIAVEPADK